MLKKQKKKILIKPMKINLIFLIIFLIMSNICFSNDKYVFISVSGNDNNKINNNIHDIALSQNGRVVYKNTTRSGEIFTITAKVKINK